MNETLRLAEFVSDLRYDNLPPKVVARTKDLILDHIGVMMACSTLPWSKAIFEYVQSWGHCERESTVVNYGLLTKAENAVFANSTFAHGFEIDDQYPSAQSHPGCVVIPAALAIAERERITGKELILAVVCGYEVMGRINRAIAPSSMNRGFHAPTSVSGPFGAAAATGKLLNFNADLMVNALSIAGSHSSGTTEYSKGGGSVKRMHAGIAAHGGVRSALVAQRGITGPASILEGRHGFCQAFADEFNLEEITKNLGSDFGVVLGVGIKAYCACGGIHPGIDALRQIIAKHSIVSEQVAAVIMGTTKQSTSHMAAPVRDITSAQFNTSFSLALTLVRGSNSFDDYTEETIHDPAILSMAERIHMEADPEIEADFPGKRSARVTVRMKDGNSYQAKVDFCKGMPQNPLSQVELEAKFRDLSSIVTEPARIEAIMTAVRRLEDWNDISSLTPLLSIKDLHNHKRT